MNSCLIETINTAIRRFAHLAVCEALSYDTQLGGKIVYIKASFATQRNSKLEKYLQFLTDASSASS